MIKVRSILLAIAAVTAIFAFAILPQLTGLSAGFNLQIEEDFQAQEQQEPFGIALINVSGCTNLTITNETYQLNTSLVGTQVGRNMCIDVQADNVTLDCLGLSLTNNDAISAGVESIFHNNLTMRNCNITDYYFGVNLTGTNNSLIENGFIISNDHTGIVLAASANVTVFNNTVYNNTFNGINVGDSSDNANISHNNITLSPFGIGTGVEIISANNASVTNNILAQQGQNSLRITSSNNSIIDNNIVADNGAIGLYIDSSTFFTDITNNNITNATAGAGIVTSGASYNRIENNTVTNSSTGINLDSGSGFNSLINNNVDNNFLQGIAISGTSLNPTENNTLINNTARNNSALDFFSEAGFTQNNTVINLEIGSVIISFTPEAISLRNGAEPATPLQDNLTHINKFINATNNSETSWLLLNVSYTDSDLTAANITNESSLFLAKHNG
ncbi:MAG TPA: right-handed parallel beta-helix repeat-containing protein, partial [Candidatus Nanoarchaeia archaeon]|nr:right-handed parallel beta-helix repeat-containing protein [Candidatus Nanoarchaeia archaeon]